MTQTTLFGGRRGGKRQQVNEERDRILEALAQKAGVRFREKAEQFIVEELRKWPFGRASESLVLSCRAAGIAPANGQDDRAFGPVFMALARAGRIQKVGAVRRERGNGTAGGNLWALKPE